MDSYILAIDPGFSDLGYAVVLLGSRRHEDVVEKMGLIRTSPPTRKQRQIRAADSMMGRSRIISDSLASLMDDYGVVAVCIEEISFVRSSSTMAKLGMTYGVIASLCADRAVPLFQVSPQEAKEAVTGRRTASKEAIKDVLVVAYGEQDVLDRKGREGRAGKREYHAWDALAAFVACSDVPAIDMARRV
jgi:Holliday junction resolvasome RuvABC endonuclease subunit